jgi:hypothetical protein
MRHLICLSKLSSVATEQSQNIHPQAATSRNLKAAPSVSLHLIQEALLVRYV